jgi:hypothetical protein
MINPPQNEFQMNNAAMQIGLNQKRCDDAAHVKSLENEVELNTMLRV